jgi:predicted AlkP superfamily pyrophosphatase or phosphodiesterase
MRFKQSAASLIVAAALSTTGAHAGDANFFGGDKHIDHVVLISVDGLHALDVENFVKTHPDSTLAELAHHGVRYTSASTSRPSDSFPGLLSLVTGGSPVSTGVFYDVSWDRSQFAPGDSQCQGTQGIQTTYDETIDLIGANNVDLNVIDATTLPYARNAKGECVHVYPHDFVKVNTIFEVIKASGRRTAWADKHAAYDLINGPSGHGVDDLYTPEITNPTGVGPYIGSYAVVAGQAPTPDATVSVLCTADNDAQKVAAVVNEINGYDHTGTRHVGTPAVLGMNFQAVSVGQKVSHNNTDGSCFAPDPDNLNGQPGGYLDGSGKPTAVLQYGLATTDAALGQMLAALKARHLNDSTLFIVSAKHGQAPIDPLKTSKPGHLQDMVGALADSSSAAAQAIINAGENEDDVAMIWLKDQSQTEAAAQYLRDNAAALQIQEVLAGESLKLKFNDPLAENRTPDIVVVPNYGTIFTTSGKKNAEHGGFSDADTNVGLLVSNPGLAEAVIKTPVRTTQVAPTILRALDIDPQSLDAVRKEHIGVLPGLGQ